MISFPNASCAEGERQIKSNCLACQNIATRQLRSRERLLRRQATLNDCEYVVIQ
jgi:hypothetical protein